MMINFYINQKNKNNKKRKKRGERVGQKSETTFDLKSFDWKPFKSEVPNSAQSIALLLNLKRQYIPFLILGDYRIII